MADAGPPLVLIALGLVLWLAINATLAGISIQTIGLIFFLAGIAWLVIELVQSRALPARRRATVVRDEPVVRERERIRTGAVVTAVAVADGVTAAVGSHLPLGSTAEIVGLGTLPAFRRRGLGGAVTGFLAEDARRRGIETIWLSAGDDEIAGVYASLGFERIGTACAAEPRRSLNAGARG